MQISIPNKENIQAVTVSGDRFRIACNRYGQDTGVIEIYDVRPDYTYGEPVVTLDWVKYATTIPTIAISPDGRYLITAHLGYIYAPNTVWEPIGNPVDFIMPIPKPTSENLILVWDLANGNIVYQDTFLMLYPTSSDFPEYIHLEFLDNDKFVTVTDVGEVAVWSISLQKMIYALSASSLQVSFFAMSPSREYFLVKESNPPRYVNNIGQQLIYSRMGRNYRILNISSRELIENRSVLRIWRLADGQLIQEIENPEVVTTDCFYPSKELIVLCTSDFVYLLDIETGMLIDRQRFTGDIMGVTDDSQNLVIQRNANTVSIWNIQQERFYKNFTFEGEIAYTKLLDGNHLAISFTDSNSIIYQIVDLGEMIVS